MSLGKKYGEETGTSCVTERKKKKKKEGEKLEFVSSRSKQSRCSADDVISGVSRDMEDGEEGRKKPRGFKHFQV